MVRRAFTVMLVGQGIFATGMGFALLFARGRPEANAHPDVRGGGDAGFGGTIDYELEVGEYAPAG